MATNTNESVHLRKYPRMPVNFPLTFVIEGNPLPRTGRARDIGGGGLAFQSEVNLGAKSALTVSFELRPGFKVQVAGRATASHRDAASGLYFHRIAFSGLADKTRDVILAHIFEHWRASLSKKQ